MKVWDGGVQAAGGIADAANSGVWHPRWFKLFVHWARTGKSACATEFSWAGEGACGPRVWWNHRQERLCHRIFVRRRGRLRSTIFITDKVVLLAEEVRRSSATSLRPGSWCFQCACRRTRRHQAGAPVPQDLSSQPGAAAVHGVDSGKRFCQGNNET
jgi:hypothetical protein